MVIGVIVMAVALLISRALTGIFGVALYRYATEGEAVGGFTAGGVRVRRSPQEGRPRTGTIDRRRLEP